MERLRMCQICMKNIADYVCKFCGRSVCSGCYYRGICIDCKAKRIPK